MVKSNMNAMRMLPLIFFLAQAPRRRLAGTTCGCIARHSEFLRDMRRPDLGARAQRQKEM
jgi:hypothetical protein